MICEHWLVDHAVAHDEVAVVAGGREQRVAAVEGQRAHRAAVQPQRLVRPRRQLQVEPAILQYIYTFFFFFTYNLVMNLLLID